MIHDLMLRWVVTGLFVLTAAECGLAIIAKRRPWTLIVNHGLHSVVGTRAPAPAQNVPPVCPSTTSRTAGSASAALSP